MNSLDQAFALIRENRREYHGHIILHFSESSRSSHVKNRFIAGYLDITEEYLEDHKQTYSAFKTVKSYKFRTENEMNESWNKLQQQYPHEVQELDFISLIRRR